LSWEEAQERCADREKTTVDVAQCIFNTGSTIYQGTLLVILCMVTLNG